MPPRTPPNRWPGRRFAAGPRRRSVRWPPKRRRRAVGGCQRGIRRMTVEASSSGAAGLLVTAGVANDRQDHHDADQRMKGARLPQAVARRNRCRYCRKAPLRGTGDHRGDEVGALVRSGRCCRCWRRRRSPTERQQQHRQWQDEVVAAQGQSTVAQRAGQPDCGHDWLGARGRSDAGTPPPAWRSARRDCAHGAAERRHEVGEAGAVHRACRTPLTTRTSSTPEPARHRRDFRSVRL